MRLVKSDRPDKRLAAIFDSPTPRVVHFGSKGKAYVDHRSKKLRKNYIARHSVNEDWNDPYSAGALSRFILWGPYQSIEENHQYFMRKFF